MTEAEWKEKWLRTYRTNKEAIWIKVYLTNGFRYFIDDFDDWLYLIRVGKSEMLSVDKLFLQFRSHEVEVDVEDAEAVYLIRSILGQFGGTDKHYYTTGILKDGIVSKKMWLIPELIVDKEFDDPIEDCFEEAMFYGRK